MKKRWRGGERLLRGDFGEKEEGAPILKSRSGGGGEQRWATALAV